MSAVVVEDAFAVRDLAIELTEGPSGRTHLILTGPNGSGKTSVLDGLYRDLSGANNWHGFRPKVSRAARIRARLTVAREPERQALEHELRELETSFARATDPPAVESPSVFVEGIDVFSEQHWVSYQRASRNSAFESVEGPARVDWPDKARGHEIDLAALLQRYLVNKRTEQAFAREAGDTETADALQAWFHNVEATLRRALGIDSLTVHVDPRTFVVSLGLDDGRRVPFSSLPDGFASVLKLWADLTIRVEIAAAESSAPGFALIDEPELHLHPELEERIMPFLVAMFPTVQFFVATHSPAVISSIDNAIVFDLGTGTAVKSEDLRGIRYGTLMTGHFGIESDFDLDTTAKLKRLQALRDAAPERGTPEWEKMKSLATELSGRSHALAMLVARDIEMAEP